MLLNKAQFTLSNIFFFTIALVLATVPFDYGINSVSLIIMTIVWVIYALNNKVKCKINGLYPYLILMLLGLLYISSYFWSIDKDYTLKGLLVKLPLFLFPFIFMTIHLRNAAINFKIVLQLFILSVLIIDMYCFIKSLQHYIIYSDLDIFFYHKLSNNANLNAIYLAYFNAISLIIILTTNILNNKTKSSAIILLLLTFLVLLSSKMVIFSLIAILFTSKLLLAKKSKKLLVLLFLSLTTTLIVLGITSNPIKNRIKEVVHSETQKVLYNKELSDLKVEGISIRLFQYRVLMEIIKENPQKIFNGFGLKAYKLKLNQKYKQYGIYMGNQTLPGISGLDFHNQYISTFLSVGILGCSILLTFLFMALLNGIKRKDEFLFAITGFFILTFLTEMSLETQRGVIVFSIIIMIALNRNQVYFNKEY